jgi:hypothetical protein
MTRDSRIDDARVQLQHGHPKDAARILTEAVYEAEDPAEIEEIHRIAEEGLSDAGFFGKSRWQEILRLADLRLEKVKVSGVS